MDDSTTRPFLVRMVKIMSDVSLKRFTDFSEVMQNPDQPGKSGYAHPFRIFPHDS